MRNKLLIASCDPESGLIINKWAVLVPASGITFRRAIPSILLSADASAKGLLDIFAPAHQRQILESEK